MCGRFTIKAKTEQLHEAVRGLTVTEWRGPRYNVAPTQPVPAVRNLGARAVEWLRWGLVPAWAKDPAIGNKLINARAETLAEKPSFRSALRARRCVILADGFYEWAVAGTRKQPYFFQRPGGRPFALAGIWESWQPPEGSPLLTCTIITTTANATVAPIHERMPVILSPDAVERWLVPATTETAPLLDLLRPWPATDLETYPVSTLVNRPAVDDPRCVEPVALPPGAAMQA
jgi:putative SOS response-associated peptidase YedK